MRTFFLWVGIWATFCVSAQGDLVSFINFDGNYSDQSGNGNVNGSFSGYQSGFEGQAGDFNSRTDFLEIPVNASPAITPAITFGAWARSSSRTGRRVIISADDGSFPRFDRQIGMDNPNGTWEYSANVGLFGRSIGTGGRVQNEWTFVAARYDGARVTLFVDDQSVSALDFTDWDQFQLPSLRVGSNAAGRQRFRGQIDNVFVFDEALSDQQIEAIRTGGAATILSMGVSAVPEPSGLFALVLGACGVLMRRQRRRLQTYVALK